MNLVGYSTITSREYLRNFSNGATEFVKKPLLTLVSSGKNGNNCGFNIVDGVLS